MQFFSPILVSLFLSTLVSATEFKELRSVDPPVCSENKQFCVSMQTDGNVVIYRQGAGPVWSSQTDGRLGGGEFTFGIFYMVGINRGPAGIRSSDGKITNIMNAFPDWDRTRVFFGAFKLANLKWNMQDDGNLVLYDKDNRHICSTNPHI